MDNARANCPLCHGKAEDVSSRWKPGPKREGHDLFACQQCGTHFVHPMPSDDELAAAYPDDFYGELGSSTGLIRELFLKERLSRLGKVQGQKVIDVGCGDGAFLKQVQDKGAQVWGVEMSENGRVLCQAEGVPAVASLDDLAQVGAQPGQADWITLWHVFEHLKDPDAMMASVKKWLSPSGKLLLAVPNIDSWEARRFGAHWFHLDLPRHLLFPPQEALIAYLGKMNFQVHRVWDFCFEYDTFGLLQSTLNKWGLPHNALYHAVKGKGAGQKAGRLPSLAAAALMTGPALLGSLALGQRGRAGTYALVATQS